MKSTANRTTLLTLGIDGMTCGHCVQAVTAGLSRVPSLTVRSVTVGSAEVETAGPDAADEVIRALKDAGYSARVRGDGAESHRDAHTVPSRGGCCGGPRGCCG